MIEFVETADGLVPKHVHARMQAHKVAAERRFRELVGLSQPVDIQRAAARTRSTLGPELMNRTYPCRTCKVVRDEKYGARCARERVKPCFLVKHYRGCANWKPLPVIA